MVDFFRRKDDELKARSQGRLPPGQALTNKFPVLHYGPVPHFNPDTWSFRVYGAVESPLELSWEQFRALPSTRMTLDLHCVTAWSKFDTQWEGLAVRTLIEAGLVRPLPNARFVIQHAEYGYTTNLPLEVVLSDNFLLAYRYEGQPLTPDHGHPLRGVVGAVPGRTDLKTPYLWKGAKWLRALEFSAEDRPGFWERAGYHNEADVWREERYG